MQGREQAQIRSSLALAKARRRRSLEVLKHSSLVLTAEKRQPMRLARVFMRFSMTFTLLLVVARTQSYAQETHESYYMTIFSAQADSRDPRRTHSFATFVKGTGTGDAAKDSPIEVHTISWMPRSLDIVILRRRPELGVNLDLESSLRWAASKGSRVSMWGPYQISKELY